MLSLFPQIAATVTRTVQTYVNGRVTNGASSTTPITVVVPQPATQKDLIILPDGERSFDHRKTYSSFAFANRDILSVVGKSFRVVAVGDWVDPDTKESYYKALLREVTHAN